jgi:hypothetical protein
MRGQIKQYRQGPWLTAAGGGFMLSKEAVWGLWVLGRRCEACDGLLQAEEHARQGGCVRVQDKRGGQSPMVGCSRGVFMLSKAAAGGLVCGTSGQSCVVAHSRGYVPAVVWPAHVSAGCSCAYGSTCCQGGAAVDLWLPRAGT